jgi:hypothetical protein
LAPQAMDYHGSPHGWLHAKIVLSPFRERSASIVNTRCQHP